MHQIVRRARETMTALTERARLDLSTDRTLSLIADTAYRKCVEWFGPASDEDWSYEVYRASRSAVVRDSSRRLYMILVDRGYTSYEQCCESIGHDMYRRVTFGRRGLREHLWVDEMLASLAGYHVLQEVDYSAYAEVLSTYHFQEVSSMDVPDLHRVRRRDWVPALDRLHPPGFVTGAFRIGIRLERLVGWDSVRGIASCSTWEQWFATLPDAEQEEALRMLLPEGH